jgi:hypothetical protein
LNVEIAWRYSSIDLIYRAHDVYSSCRSFHSYCGARKVDAFPAEPGMMIQACSWEEWGGMATPENLRWIIKPKNCLAMED